ncbi:MAG: 2-C-methyl-D-erythritol 4-phosphate cytidylyltransferase [Chloroflexi bacterium]|nr:2-C-methyl-D-erythritol 4-phosphate cytidylyltransferase [Chloroflexota bacterium]
MTDASRTLADTTAIVVAAGSGERMGGVEKAFLQVLGRPLIAYTLSVLEDSPEIRAVVLVVAQARVARASELVSSFGFRKVVTVCAGGSTRRASVRAGLSAVPDADGLIAILDGARPCLTPQLVSAGIAAARATGAAIAAVPVQDTIKEVGPGGLVMNTPDRTRLVATQTPQVFSTSALRQAHREAPSHLLLDDATLFEAIGWPVHVYPGDPANIKVTTPADVLVVEAILRQRGVTETVLVP